MNDGESVEEVFEEFPPTPFSFKLMVALMAVYVGWRLIQGVIWLWNWAT